SECVSLRVTDEYLRERPDLHRLALEAWRLDPSVIAVRVEVGEVGNSLALPRMQTTTLVVRVGSVVCEPLRGVTIVGGVCSLHATDMACHDVSAGQIELRALAVERKVGDR